MVRVMSVTPLQRYRSAVKRIEKQIAALALGEGEIDAAREDERAVNRAISKANDLAYKCGDDADRDTLYREVGELNRRKIAAAVDGHAERGRRRCAEIARLTEKIREEQRNRPW
jgi:hypothetical protein